jgi:putative ABC transport system substrate-binding protein
VLGPKRLALLQELMPKMAVIGVVANPAFAYTEEETKDVLAAGRALDKQIHIATASTEGEIDAAFGSLVERRVDALMVEGDPFFTSRRGRFIALAAHHAVPVMYFSRDFAADGGLISYGPNLANAYHQVGVYAGQILNGSKPANLPVLQPTKFELVINLKTARTLGLTVPDKLLALADEVIE